MNLDQFRELLDARGADLSAWPTADRAAAERLLADDARARTFHAEAVRLDRALGSAMRAASSGEQASEDRVLSALARQPLPRQRCFALRWPAALLDVDLAPAWPRVAALAGVMVFGIAIGLVGPDFGRDIRGWTTAGATDLPAVVFEPEPLTGVEP